MSISVGKFSENDLMYMIRIWNDVIEDGTFFPQEKPLTLNSGRDFFTAQTYCGVAKNSYGDVVGVYTIHPYNVGRCSHIANARYAVSKKSRAQHIGEKLVLDCMTQAKEHGFRILQFNAIVKSNIHARHLYEKLGFVQLGTIPGGFRMKDGTYENICMYYIEL